VTTLVPATQDDSLCNALLTAAGYDPVSVDQLAERSNLSAAEVQAGLLTLELDGKIELLPGGQYRRIGKI
jgi:DNA processing protein